VNKIFLGAVLLLVACGAPPPRIIPPTPDAITISILPSLEPAVPALVKCSQSLPDTVLFVARVPASAVASRSADLTLWLGNPPGNTGFAAPLVLDELAVVVNRTNPVESLEIGDLRAIFSGREDNWAGFVEVDSRVSVWVYPEGNELQALFSGTILGGSRLTSFANLAPGVEAMLEAVAADPAAIGFLPGAWLDDTVRQVQVAGVSLHMPVLLLAGKEPQGNVRAFASCLQNREGLDLLLERYSALDGQRGGDHPFNRP
jgi:hypothetical protein